MSLVKNNFKNRVNKVIDQKQSQFYKRHNHCSLCAKELAIEVLTDFKSLDVTEKVSCSHCKVTISNSTHGLN